MSTPSEPQSTPPPPQQEPQGPHNPIPPSIANNPMMKGALDNPYGDMATTHPADVPVGLILMILGGLGALWLLRAGFFLGSFLGGIYMFYVLIGIICSAGTGLGGYGIWKGKRWGFMMAAAAGLIGLIFSVLYISPINLVVNVGAVVYGFLRLTGQLKA